MKIFVTGATGFLGRHLIPALCRAGHSVRILTRTPAQHTWLAHFPNVEIIQGDILDKTALIQAVQGCEYVIHAAGNFRFWGEEEAFYQANLSGTQNILQASLQAQVKRFVYISTVAVIGQPNPEQVIDEGQSAHPADAYQKSKLAAETEIINASQQGLSCVILRAGAFYGPLGSYAFNRLFFKDPMRGLIMQMDRGRHVIFPVYVGDVAAMSIAALTKGRSGEIYNISGASITHKDAFDIICREANIRFPRISVPGWTGIALSHVLEAVARLTGHEPFYPLNLRSYVYNDWHVSSEKARRELGFIPLDFTEGVRRTIAWYRAGEPESIPEVEC